MAEEVGRRALAALVGELLPPEDEAAQRLHAHLSEFLDLAGGAFAANTLAAWTSDLKLFRSWCSAGGLPWLPATPKTLVAFVRAIGAKRRPASIARYLDSIGRWHRAADLPDPTRSLSVDLARRTHARAHGIAQKQAPGLGWREREEILETLEVKAEQRGSLTAVDARDRALLLVASDTLARASEVVELRWEDIVPTDEGGATILIRRSKTDQAGAGRTAWLSPQTLKALEAWRTALLAFLAALHAEAERKLAERREGAQRFYRSERRLKGTLDAHVAARARLAALPPVRPGERIFWQLSRRPANRLSRQAVTAIFKERAAAALGKEDYSAHSTRVGTIQDLVADGADVLGAMNAGGYKSPAMVARYAQHLLATRGAVAQMRRKKASAKQG
jgi:site-specific recombinase XerD